MIEEKNYCTKDGTCSATCLEEVKACLFSDPSKMHGDACTYCNQNNGCMSPEAHRDAIEG